jgi:hypothetical protein
VSGIVKVLAEEVGAYLATLDLPARIDRQMWVCSRIICVNDTDIQHLCHTGVLLQNLFECSLVGMTGIVAPDDDAER